MPAATPPPPRPVAARFVDGPYSGVTRRVAPGSDGEPDPLLTLPLPGGRADEVVIYERVDPTGPADVVRYRVAPVPLV